MNSDLAITKKAQDKLGRSVIADEIARGLVLSFKDTSESIVIGINGPWGSGKSSLINLIIDEVEILSKSLKHDLVILRFNPWMFSGQKELQTIFFKELFSKLEGGKSKVKKVSKKLAEFLQHLNWLKYVHSGAGELVKDSKGWLESLSTEKDLSELKEDIDELLINSKIKLYITIDDIDRLSPSEITDFFQLVKLNGSFANTVFLLAYDQDVVVAALNSEFGYDGKKYLEKIIQVDYTLPLISKVEIVKIFKSSLEFLFKDKFISKAVLETLPKLESEVFVEMFSNLRDVYRFNNAIKLRLPSIYKELNIRDFFLVETLRIFRPDVYKFIINSKDELTRTGKERRVFDFEGNSKKFNPSELISEQKFDSASKRILNSLFVFEGLFNQLSNEHLVQQKRVGNKWYFERYFNLQLAEVDIRENDIESFIDKQSASVSRISILQEIHKNELLGNFLYLVDLRIKSNKSDVVGIISASLKFSEELNFFHQFRMFESDLLGVLRFCSRLLDRTKDIKTRRKLIIDHINVSPADLKISNLYVCHSVIYIKGLFDEDKLNDNHLWSDLLSIDKDDNERFIITVTEIYKKGLVSFFGKVVNGNEIINDDELRFVIDELRRYDEKYYKSAFAEFLANDKNLLRMVLICILSVSWSSGGIVANSLTVGQLFDGMDSNEIKKRFDSTDLSSIDKLERSTIAFFNKAYSDGFHKEKYYLFETAEEINSNF